MNGKVLLAGLALVAPLLGVLYANLGRDPHAVNSPLVGRAAPSFTLASLHDEIPMSLSHFSGKPIVMNFWASWCVPCEEEHEALMRASRASGDRAQFLGVVYEDDADRIKAFLRARGEAYPTLLDPEGKAAIAYGVYGVPETYFIDASGKIVAKHVGPLTDEAIAANLAKAQGASR